ncbi:helix-turn-helix domain-containing protein [Streptomyces sp. NBC_01220]|uniref:winged helix-turn-helix domain-containing protein n=1 Tax=Streptomyces sp. NBC_01220 TaxID=2903781 RepID=UPI00352CD7E9|nr:helix-turn-helix domain-containing protein [Streptomyces sp. NBC_01220]
MRISDPKAIRALAHPLRLDLLELLTAAGPATAAHCGRVLEVSQASCSFHLRQLAKYGFVEDAGPGRDRRERAWQVPGPRREMRIAVDDSPDVGPALERIVVEREAQAILDHVGRRDAGSVNWRQKAGVMLREQWKALLAPYVARTEKDSADRLPGQRHVRYFMAATPLPAFESGDSGHESEH